MNDATPADENVSLGKLAQDFKVVVHDAEGLIKATAGDLGDKAREARTRLTASLASAKIGFHNLEDRALAGAKATDRVIRDYPYQALGIAFGVGLIFGALVIRR